MITTGPLVRARGDFRRPSFEDADARHHAAVSAEGIEDASYRCEGFFGRRSLTGFVLGRPLALDLSSELSDGTSKNQESDHSELSCFPIARIFGWYTAGK